MSTLKVEDGLGLSNANSYVSLAYANSYHSARGNDSWFIPDKAIAQEQALMNASYSVDQKYGGRYLSEMLTLTQALLFPRYMFKDNNGRLVEGIPNSLKNAVCEEALLIFNGEDVYRNLVEKGITSESVSVGPISESKSYDASYAKRKKDPRFRNVELALSPLLYSSSQGSIIRG